MSRRTFLPIAIAAVFATACIMLGTWQLRRRAERAARNASVAARLAEAPAPLTAAAPLRRYQRVFMTGVADYSQQLVLTHRTREGSPGVHLLTPVRVAGRDTLILVNRGWVYSFDASRIDAVPWRESDTLVVQGWLDSMPEGTPAPIDERRIARLELAKIRPLLASPVSPFVVVATGESVAVRNRPARLPPPSLDPGPHLSYAIQWFSFALIALVGTGYWVISQRRRTLPNQ